MYTQNLEPLEQVLSNYDIKVDGIIKESFKQKKGVWWIEADKGKKVLKKLSNSENTVRYILSAVRHLSENGILIPRINVNKNGEEYIKIGETCYILSDAIDGRNPSYNVPKELEMIVKGLARFHRASRGFEPKFETKPKINLGTWIEAYIKQAEESKKFYLNDAAKTDNEIKKLIVSEFPYFYDRALKAVEQLEKGKDYKEWGERACRIGSLCHQDFASGNLLIDSAGNLNVLDVDAITIDIFARDIRKLLNKVMKQRGGWDIILTEKIFKWYQEDNPLTPSEWSVVKLDLMFPHLFMGVINKYYYHRDKEWTPEKYLKQIQSMCMVERSVETVLEKFESIIPK